MINLAGYDITKQIHESNNSLVYRGLRKQDNQPVILKFLKQDYPLPASLVRYKQEYEITHNLNLESGPKTYSLERYHNSLAIIFEDCGGDSLKLLLASHQLTLEEFLLTAIKITRALGEIHRHKIIHKDINPSNIIINSTTGRVQIIDFGISTVLKRENPTLKNPNVLEGTLSYISPEQTGRMNRAIDYRTDFYSLGVTFYELLTRQLPWDYSDAMELIHCHIAKQAVPPHQINLEIPKAVSDIVMKLLAKTAEARYQSPWGIIADLEECLEQLKTTGGIADFAIAQKDITDKFQIPQKLYGREREIETLLAAFERVSRGSTEMMLVSGYSGIGKSALVQEVYKPITKARGYFIAGKFDQFQRNIPYAAIINAFRSLLKQILTESEAQLVQWKEKILAFLGKNGQVIIDVVPEVELIVGKQPAVPELASAESQNRFNSIFQKFIGVFCSSEHPLLIFLDDLQWADSATLKLLEVIMTDAQTRYLFLIGAYRDNEVDAGHPLMITLDLLQSKGAAINKITLVPLAIEHICNLICDTLHANTIVVEPLAQLVIRKTSGNPFFVNQFLKTLYQEDLLTFILPSQGSKPQWQWDIALIEAIGITDNVVELMVRKLRKLPPSTQQVLQLAACVGNTFDLHTLSIIHETSAAVAYQNLLPAIQEDLVLPISDLEFTPEQIINSPIIILAFKFLHDRVQQAAYGTIPEEHKKEVHLKIGQLLLKNTTEEELEEKVFDLVNHLNIGVELIDNLEQKVKLSNLNLIAGKKAKASTAYKTAATYFALGIKLLGIQAWENYYELTFTLYRERSECEYLAGNLEEAEELFKIALSNSQSAIDKAEIYSLYTFFCSTLSRKDEALKFTLAGLECLGMDLPRTEEELPKAVEVELQQVSLNLSQRKVADLINAHELRDLTKRASIKLLIDLWAVAYYVGHQNWLDLSILKIVNMSLRYGNTDLSAFGYVTYGMLLSSRNEYKLAYEFGKLALKLNDKFNNKSLSCKVPNLFALRINPYNNHLKTNLDIFRTAYKGGLECGDLVYIVWTIMFSIWTRFIIGQPLKEVYEESCKYIAVMKQTNDLSMLYGFMSLQQTTLNLQGLTKDKYSFDDEIYSEALCLQHWENTKFYHVKTWYITFKAQVLFIYENYTEALKLAQENEKIINNFGFFNITQHYFYYSLILAAVYSKATIDEKENYWEILHNNLEKTKVWADSCPGNYLHQYLLIAAEIARISGKDLEAMDLYDKAIASARKNEYIQNEALGNELAAKFWLAKGKEDFAQLYMQKAHYGYQIWGAQR